MPAPPPPSSLPPAQNPILRKTASLPDVIFTAFSLLVLFTTSPKPIHFLFPSTKLSFPLSRRFRKMSTSLPNPRIPGRGGHPPPPFATPQSLSDWLKPRLASDLFGSWGIKPGTKNVHNLWLEIAEGETFLADSSPPIRTVEVVIVRIIGNDGKLLVESHQELSDGSIRHRCRPLSEKMKPGESVEASVLRAVKEELGSILKYDFHKRNFDNERDWISEFVKIRPGSYVKKVEERASVSYPGLPARYVLHTVDAEVKGSLEDEFCTEEKEEYGDIDRMNVADCAVSCRKHYWKWIDPDSV